MPYDPTIYRGSAAYYARGRPPYSRELSSTIAREIGLDGSGRLLDVGCGPGIVALELAHLFEEVIGLDPDPDMVAEAARRAAESGIDNARWVQALAEDIPAQDLGTFRLVTFAQSFHWTDREAVAEVVYDLLEPGGAVALIAPVHEGRPVPAGPGHPSIPHDDIRAVVDRYLGPKQRSGQGFVKHQPDRYADALGRTRFGRPRSVFAPGRPDIVRDIDGVIAGYYSMSFAAPHLFGDRLAAFEADVRSLLEAHSSDGLYWDWPGDTEVLLADKPA